MHPIPLGLESPMPPRRRAEYTVRNVETTTALFRANTSPKRDLYMVVPASLLVIVTSQFEHEGRLYSTTWKIIHDLSGKSKKPSVKVRKRDGTSPMSDKDLLAEWR